MTIGRTRIGPQAKNSIQTADATADQLLLNVAIPFKHTATVDLYITGICQATGAKLIVYSVHDVSRDGATATYNGLTSRDAYDTSGGWVDTVDCSGENLRVRVTGAAATTIRWTAVAYFNASAVNVPIIGEWSTNDTTQSIVTRFTNTHPYWVDWGDGSFTAGTGTGGTVVVTHNYAAAGEYAVRWMVDALSSIVYFKPSTNGYLGPMWNMSGWTNALQIEFASNRHFGDIPPLSTNTTQFSCASNPLLAGSLPSLAGMGSLTTFNASNCELTGSIPSIAALVAATTFYVNGNNLTGSIPSLAGLAAMQFFYTYDNQLTGSIPSVSDCVALKRFRCYINQLTGSIPDLTNCVQLIDFQCYNNALTGYTPSTIALTCTTLDARNNALSETAVDDILADFEDNIALRPSSGIIALEGGTNAPPSAAGLASKAAILAQWPAWTITHN